MHAMIRSYSGKGAKELVDVIEKRKKDVEEILRSVSGLVNYSMVRTKTGGFSVSVWRDKASIDEVHQKAMEWVKENASTTNGSKPPKPEVHEGAVVVQLN
jgi:heme-degrading monooxygenase HmoA